jgi:hypothetical protein
VGMGVVSLITGQITPIEEVKFNMIEPVANEIVDVKIQAAELKFTEKRVASIRRAKDMFNDGNYIHVEYLRKMESIEEKFLKNMETVQTYKERSMRDNVSQYIFI